jgi:hypothetical protein
VSSDPAATPSAPIAPAPAPESAAAPSARGGWTVTDILVMLAALTVLGLSIAGLVWLLRS